MIGRAAPANPWIFRQIAQYTATGRYDRPTEFDRYRMIRAYFEMLLEEIALEEAQAAAKAQLNQGAAKAQVHREAAGKMKQFAAWFTHGVPGGAGLRRNIFEAKTGARILEAVDEFFASRMSDVCVENEWLNDEVEESCPVVEA
jgi:tRNA-dihydrouridine synthase